MLLQGSSGWAALDLLIATVFSSKKYERRLDRTGEAGMHINLCEVKDIVEEIERRVESRKIKGAA
jgi:hypothetical protein